MHTLTADELRERLDCGEDLHLIDVLPRVSFDKQHLPNAAHASFYDDDFLASVGSIVDELDDTIVVYCLTRSCNASARAAQALVDAGYRNVFDFEGGLREWEEAGQPVIRGRG